MATVKETITYRELSDRVGQIVLMNKIIAVDTELELENGNDYDTENDEYVDIYQYYAITQSGAEYLLNHTDEIVYYSDKLDAYFWGITHFGTLWDSVSVDIIEKE